MASRWCCLLKDRDSRICRVAFFFYSFSFRSISSSSAVNVGQPLGLEAEIFFLGGVFSSDGAAWSLEAF
jgi:hypothetical protein